MCVVSTNPNHTFIKDSLELNDTKPWKNYEVNDAMTRILWNARLTAAHSATM